MGPKIEPCGTPWVTVSGSDSDVAMRANASALLSVSVSIDTSQTW